MALNNTSMARRSFYLAIAFVAFVLATIAIPVAHLSASSRPTSFQSADRARGSAASSAPLCGPEAITSGSGCGSRGGSPSPFVGRPRSTPALPSGASQLRWLGAWVVGSGSRPPLACHGLSAAPGFHVPSHVRSCRPAENPRAR